MRHGVHTKTPTTVLTGNLLVHTRMYTKVCSVNFHMSHFHMFCFFLAQIIRCGNSQIRCPPQLTGKIFMETWCLWGLKRGLQKRITLICSDLYWDSADPRQGPESPFPGKEGFGVQKPPISPRPYKGWKRELSVQKSPFSMCSLVEKRDFFDRNSLFQNEGKWEFLDPETLFSRKWGFAPLSGVRGMPRFVLETNRSKLEQIGAFQGAQMGTNRKKTGKSEQIGVTPFLPTPNWGLWYLISYSGKDFSWNGFCNNFGRNGMSFFLEWEMQAVKCCCHMGVAAMHILLSDRHNQDTTKATASGNKVRWGRGCNFPLCTYSCHYNRNRNGCNWEEPSMDQCQSRGNSWRTFSAIAPYEFPWNSHRPMAPKSLWKFWSTPVSVHRVLFLVQ